jgi:RimJ/RimL family protein N-acetyltransferase
LQTFKGAAQFDTMPCFQTYSLGHISMQVRPLAPQDAFAFQSIRLQGLIEVPTAFASSHEDEVSIPIEEVARRLEPKADGAIFGTFCDGPLVGVLGVQREGMRKLNHKAFIWGMYVVPAARVQGCGALLLQRALEYAWQTLGVRQVNLGVHALNAPALNLYRRFGFEIFGTELGSLRVGGLPQDEYHMVCRAQGVA